MGQLIPVGHYEVLPGDSVRHGTSALIRVSPLMTPVMHPVSVRLHHWFVPYRILSDQWEDFITGGTDGMGDGATLPTVPLDTQGEAGKLGNYLGLPLTTTSSQDVLAWPFMAYNKIWNEFYRDQDLQTEVDEYNGLVLPVAWEKDYFTSARPWTQKGPEVTLPIGATAPVISDGSGPTFQNSGGSAQYGLLNQTTGSEGVGVTSAQATSGQLLWAAPHLNVDLTQATSSTVNDVRRAFAIQRYQEARAQYGSRYTEYLRYLGVRSSDARLQRPEYLGGAKATISFSEVLRTGDVSTDTDPAAPIGEMRGHGIAALRSRRFVRFFEEHGIVMTLASIRPRTMYQDGVHRSWIRQTKEDYWQKELEQIGQQDIKNVEVYGASGTPAGTFGYQDRYSDYRHLPSYVCGDFRTTMNDWHLARSFASQPTLNASFIECDPSKRIHAEQTTNTMWCMFSHSIQARRMVGRKTIGRIF